MLIWFYDVYGDANSIIAGGAYLYICVLHSLVLFKSIIAIAGEH